MRGLTARPACRRLPLLAALLLPATVLAACHTSTPATHPGPTGSATARATPSALPPASPSPTATMAASPSPGPTVASSPVRSPSPAPSATSVLSSAGPYTTVQAAETYANGQTGAPFTFSTGSWQAGATLKVLHGTPSESAGYGGDFYFFFVNGRSVGTHSFAQATTSSLVGGTGFQVTFAVYKPGDPMCCPSGGQSTVTFSWNGTSLSTSGSLAGANLS